MNMEEIKINVEKEIVNSTFLDTTGSVIQNGDTILLYNKDLGKWSTEHVEKEGDILYGRFPKFLNDIFTPLNTVPSNFIVIIKTSLEQTLFHNDEFGFKN